LFFIGILYLKTPPISTIKAILIMTIFLLIAEFGDIYILTNIIGKEKFDLLMSDRLTMNLIGLPTSILFAIMNSLSYFLLVV
jgi:hypothetical protein